MAKWCPTVILEIPLYDVDKDDNIIPFDDDEAYEVLQFMRQRDDYAGYTIANIHMIKKVIER